MDRFLKPGPLLVLAALCFIPVSIHYFDRPIAIYMHAHAYGWRPIFLKLGHVAQLLEILAAIALLWSAIKFLRGRLSGFDQIFLRAGLALFVGIGVKDFAKIVFGRTWPETWICNNPSFIEGHVFRFFPFHGGPGFGSFPSGHETLVCSLAGALWVLAPRFRPLYVLAAVLTGAFLLVADFHWLSDIVAGALLGWLIGVFIAKLDLPRADAPRGANARRSQEA